MSKWTKFSEKAPLPTQKFIQREVRYLLCKQDSCAFTTERKLNLADSTREWLEISDERYQLYKTLEDAHYQAKNKAYREAGEDHEKQIETMFEDIKYPGN